MSDGQEHKGAGEALAAAAIAALRQIAGLTGIYEGAPVQAAIPFAIVDAGAELDWSHKTGIGREVRLAVTLRDQAERPTRLRGLAAETEGAIEGLGAELEGWRLVTLRFVRSRLVCEAVGRWAAVLDYRARLLADPPAGAGP